MIKTFFPGNFLLLIVLVSLIPSHLEAAGREDLLIQLADTFLHRSANQMIPAFRRILSNSHGVILIPRNQPGLDQNTPFQTGILFARLEDGSWSNPYFIRLTGPRLQDKQGDPGLDQAILVQTKQALNRLITKKTTAGIDLTIQSIQDANRPTPMDQIKSDLVSIGIGINRVAPLSMVGTTIEVDQEACRDFYRLKKEETLAIVHSLEHRHTVGLKSELRRIALPTNVD